MQPKFSQSALRRIVISNLTLASANTTPRLYVGGAVAEPRAKEWVSWKAGFMETAFVMSARAPSKMKFVRWVAK